MTGACGDASSFEIDPWDIPAPSRDTDEPGTAAPQEPDPPDCTGPRVGATGLRRLSRAEFDGTIRDLLGVDGTYSAGFVPDERAGPFTSNAIAPVSELQVEQYAKACESIAAEASADLDRLLPCDPAVVGRRKCAKAFFAEFVPRAYRRPIEQQELDRVMDVYAAAKAAGEFRDGIRVGIAAVLQSPMFLYHVELGAPADTTTDGLTAPLTDHEMASRLSYFLWGTMPDDELFAAADTGLLTESSDLAEQVDRMIADPRFEVAITRFHTQWLGVDELSELYKDPERFPEFSPELAASMHEDVGSLARHILLDGDGTIDALLTAPVTLTDDPDLLALYGATVPTERRPGAPVPLPSDERAGLLTTPAVLSRLAHADQSSPILRGAFVRQHLLCQPLPSPPPDADDVAPAVDPTATTRERFSQHTADPACLGCHELIDPIGFGFEHYDAVGAYRHRDGGAAVDASGELVGTDIDGEFEGAVDLAHRLARSPAVRQCIALQWLRYALGRAVSSEDQCTLDELYASVAESGGDIRALIHQIVQSDAFRFVRPPTEAP